MTFATMTSNRNRLSLAALAAAASFTAFALTPTAASAGGMPHTFTYINNDVGTPAISGSSSVIQVVRTSFSEIDNSMSWFAQFEADSLEELPTGFTLVVNDGPAPKTHLGELAVLYFEAEEKIASLADSAFANTFSGDTDSGLTAYAYNGGSSASAHRTSNFQDVQSATPDAPDQIASSRNNTLDYVGVINQYRLTNGKFIRVISVDFDATPILNHTPLQPSLDFMDDRPLTWTGIGFAETIGIWFHPFNNINAEYIEGGDEDGFLKHGIGGFAQHGIGDPNSVQDGWQVVNNNYGFFDVDDLDATLKDGQPIPEPASALLLLAGASVLARRRR
ncbi:MAG: PEP-CTERM sorting domain-containing protein [Planctomycetota bacterium]